MFPKLVPVNADIKSHRQPLRSLRVQARRGARRVYLLLSLVCAVVCVDTFVVPDVSDTADDVFGPRISWARISS